MENSGGHNSAGQEKVFDIRERSFQFAVRIVKLCRHLEEVHSVSKILINQLLDSGTSVGSNLEEAKAGQSPKDFVHKNAISLKEARESKYWLRLLLASYDLDSFARNESQELTDEADEIARIVGKIIVNSKRQDQ